MPVEELAEAGTFASSKFLFDNQEVGLYLGPHR